VVALTCFALLLMDQQERKSRRQALRSGNAGGGSSPIPRKLKGVCCACSLVWKQLDKVVEFVGNALLWTGALCLKRTIDETAGLHGEIWRDGQLIPPPENRLALGFVYAGVMVVAALFVGILIDWRVHHLLNKALKLAEDEASRPTTRDSSVGRTDATMWRMRYEFTRRGGGMIQKCLAYTSAAQTSTAVVNALGSFPTNHYWM
jgi:hypothetical protein